ncbi:hypothetical protein [Peptococcus simiae]|uniref:hypothetical protein n=1 Tax=Peptococcus simiae TaxID=1643805 RepID=UPI00397EB7C2
MGIIEELKDRYSDKLTEDEALELSRILREEIKESDLVTIDDHKEFLALVTKVRKLADLGLKLSGKNCRQTITDLLAVGENGVYQNSLRFLYELIQNIDDCEYDSIEDCHLDIKFNAQGEVGYIELRYNERGFTPKDVFAITGIAEASKNISADKMEIGEKA